VARRPWKQSEEARTKESLAQSTVAQHRVCQGRVPDRVSEIRVDLFGMNIDQMLVELREEREQVDQAILVLERIVAGQARRRGRAPKWMTQVKRRGRPPGSKKKQK